MPRALTRQEFQDWAERQPKGRYERVAGTPLRPEIIHHRRTGDRIETTIVTQGSIHLDPPGIILALDAVYAA